MKVLDVGSGPGCYVDAMRAVGLDAEGWDPSGPADPARCLYRVNCLELDPLIPDIADVVVSLEVAEHLPESEAQHFVSCLAKLAPTVYFSAAHVGQGGFGHLNCQDKDYWRERFAAAGMAEDDAETRAAVADVEQGHLYMNWLPQNLMVMKRLDSLYYDKIVEEETPQAERLARYLKARYAK